MVYKSRFYPHYKALLRKQIAAKGQKDNNNNNPLFLTNPRDIEEFLWTHYISKEELR